jgi:DNA mismatch repair protein MutH
VGALRELPENIQQLLQRARALSGLTVAELAARFNLSPREDPRATKGWIGELLERALGATAGSADIPDFPHLGVELKTIPIDRQGRVTESTFVCAIDLDSADRTEWPDSRAWRKLRCVLWVPITAAKEAKIGRRLIGQARLWQPTSAEQQLLRSDWEYLMGLIALGDFEQLTAHRGEALQVRPKAADASVKTEVVGLDGEVATTGPRGFYLRARFTEQLLWRLSDDQEISR